MTIVRKVKKSQENSSNTVAKIDQQNADLVIKMIKELNGLDLSIIDNVNKVQEMRLAYDLLSEAEKLLVINISELIEKELIITNLESNSYKGQAVVELIEKMDNSDQDLVEVVKSSYDVLDDGAKIYVFNYYALEAAERNFRKVDSATILKASSNKNLWVAADDEFDVYINGSKIGNGNQYYTRYSYEVNDNNTDQ